MLVLLRHVEFEFFVRSLIADLGITLGICCSLQERSLVGEVLLGLQVESFRVVELIVSFPG